jgi:hypothetical protein
MATPIAPTPPLDERESRNFLKKMEDGLKHPVGLVPTPKLNAFLDKIISDAEKRKKQHPG